MPKLIATLITLPLGVSELVTSDILRLAGVCVSAAASCYAAWSARQSGQEARRIRKEVRRRRRKTRDANERVVILDEPDRRLEDRP